MKNTLVVVADLACLKAYRLDQSELNRTPRLEPVEEVETPEAHGKLVDRVSDLAGRFPRGGPTPNGSAMADGERHNIDRELRKRLVRQLARRFNQLARGKEIERCLLAASKEINHQLLEELEPEVRAKIFKNVSADLTTVERTAILDHF